MNFPTQSPVNVKTPKSITSYHLSWTYILTIAHILLIDNETNIDDRDQLNIMKEVLSYFETQKSGIVGFHQMKWAPGRGKSKNKLWCFIETKRCCSR